MFNNDVSPDGGGGPGVPVPENRPFAEVLADFRWAPLSLCGRLPGIWPVDKPSGPSSNLIVTRARKALGIRQIGHAGTLDPMAGGLLVLLAGNATRLFDCMQEFPKTYRAEFRLGMRTDSQDATGSPLAGWTRERLPPVPEAEARAVLERFRGDILQTPPMHSALKRDGVPLYKLARKGTVVERVARPVTVHELLLESFDGEAGVMSMRVSKGFYVRTLIDDFGVALGSGAAMTSLRRTAIGPFDLSMTKTLPGLNFHFGSGSE